MKKLTAAVLAAALTLGCASTAFANEAIDDAIELNQYNFEEKEAVSGRFLNLLASYPGETATWQTEDYAFTFRSEDVPEELDDRSSVNLHMERIKDRLSIYDKAVGRDTPKYVFKTEAESFKVPFEDHPGKQFHAGFHRYTFTVWTAAPGIRAPRPVFSAVKKDVVVAENGDVSFPMTEGGTYLVSAKPVVSHEGELRRCSSRWNMNSVAITTSCSPTSRMTPTATSPTSGKLPDMLRQKTKTNRKDRQQSCRSFFAAKFPDSLKVICKRRFQLCQEPGKISGLIKKQSPDSHLFRNNQILPGVINKNALLRPEVQLVQDIVKDPPVCLAGPQLGRHRHSVKEIIQIIAFQDRPDAVAFVVSHQGDPVFCPELSEQMEHIRIQFGGPERIRQELIVQPLPQRLAEGRPDLRWGHFTQQQRLIVSP